MIGKRWSSGYWYKIDWFCNNGSKTTASAAGEGAPQTQETWRRDIDDLRLSNPAGASLTKENILVQCMQTVTSAWTVTDVWVCYPPLDSFDLGLIAILLKPRDCNQQAVASAPLLPRRITCQHRHLQVFLIPNPAAIVTQRFPEVDESRLAGSVDNPNSVSPQSVLPKTKARLNYLTWTSISKATSLWRSYIGGTVHCAPQLMWIPLGGVCARFLPRSTMSTLETVQFVWKSNINLPLPWKQDDLKFIWL